VKILLTGGSGFIGRHVQEAFGSELTIVAPSHVTFDVTDAGQVDRMLRGNRFDAIIHAAVQGGPQVMESTLRGYWNLSRNASFVDRILYFGSGAEYGKHRDLTKVKEEAVGDEVPRDPYGLAKLLCNTMCRQSANVINLRLFGVYGPHEGYAAKFISNAVAKTLVGLPLVIRQNVVFDYLWVDDLMRLVRRLLQANRTVADLNITPTVSVSLTEIASAVLREAERAPEIEIETPGLNYQYTGDNSRLMQLVPGFTFTSLQDGVRQLFAHYRSRMDTIDREALAADDYRRRCAARQPATN
jgi:GDP-L-fucose synthase